MENEVFVLLFYTHEMSTWPICEGFNRGWTEIDLFQYVYLPNSDGMMHSDAIHHETSVSLSNLHKNLHKLDRQTANVCEMKERSSRFAFGTMLAEKEVPETKLGLISEIKAVAGIVHNVAVKSNRVLTDLYDLFFLPFCIPQRHCILLL
jgi:hypothetical protein